MKTFQCPVSTEWPCPGPSSAPSCDRESARQTTPATTPSKDRRSLATAGWLALRHRWRTRRTTFPARTGIRREKLPPHPRTGAGHESDSSPPAIPRHRRVLAYCATTFGEAKDYVRIADDPGQDRPE